MSLSQFISHTKLIGLPLGCKYKITLPDDFGGVMSFLCDQIQVPGVSISTNEIRTMGEISELSYGVTYQALPLSFILDNNFSTRVYFEKWMQKVYNRVTRTSGYYKDYAKTVDIFVLDRNDKPIYSVKLYNAYPKTMSDTPLSNANREIMKCDISLLYQFWERNAISASGEIDASSSAFNTAGGVSLLAQNIGFNGLLPNALGLETINNVSFNKDANGFGLSTFGTSLGATFTRLGNSSSALLTSSGLSSPSLSTLGSDLGGFTKNLGTGMGSFGAGLNLFGDSITNIVGPVGKIGSSIGAVSGTLSSISTLLNKVGISTGLGKVSKDLAQLSGSIGRATQLSGAVGDLKSIGANMGATGGELNNMVESLKTLPNATQASMNSLLSLGSAFSNNGNDLGIVASNYE